MIVNKRMRMKVKLKREREKMFETLRESERMYCTTGSFFLFVLMYVCSVNERKRDEIIIRRRLPSEIEIVSGRERRSLYPKKIPSVLKCGSVWVWNQKDNKKKYHQESLRNKPTKLSCVIDSPYCSRTFPIYKRRENGSFRQRSSFIYLWLKITKKCFVFFEVVYILRLRGSAKTISQSSKSRMSLNAKSGREVFTIPSNSLPIRSRLTFFMSAFFNKKRYITNE